MNKTVCIYCRCANNEDDGLNKQKSQMIEFAKQKGLNVVKVIAEIGSGLNQNRKGLREIAKIAKQKKVDMILTKDVSRISRDYIAEIKFIEQIKKMLSSEQWKTFMMNLMKMNY